MTQLRFPDDSYWDWTDSSTGKEGIPDLLKPKEVKLNLPDGGTQILKDNPLATYKFENPRPDGFANIQNSGKDQWTPFLPGETAFFKDWTNTYRWPTSELEPMEQYNLLNQYVSFYRMVTDPTARYFTLNHRLLIDDDEINRYGWKTLRSNVAHIFTFPLTVEDEDEYPFIWDEFSNTTFQSKKTKADRGFRNYKAGSVEHPHNSVHLLLGGLGHMSNNDYAGFDPIFYLHHCNIDRILAFWEYVYPNYWMGHGYMDKSGDLIRFEQPFGTYSEKPNAVVDEYSVLEPFRHDNNAYWNPIDTHGLTTDKTVYKGYTFTLTYETDTIDVSKPCSKAQRAKHLKTLQHYFGLDIEASKREHWENHPIVPILKTPDSAPPRRFKEISDYRHFIIVADILEHAYDGSYRLEILYRNNSIGAVTSLARGLDTLCAACQGRRQIGNRVQGTVAIHQYVVNQMYSLVEQNEQLSEDQFLKVLKGIFSARLVGPTGAILATANYDVDPTSDNALPNEKCPNITIHSASAATHEEDEYCLFFDDKEYGTILEGKWVSIPPEQRVRTIEF